VQVRILSRAGIPSKGSYDGGLRQEAYPSRTAAVAAMQAIDRDRRLGGGGDAPRGAILVSRLPALVARHSPGRRPDPTVASTPLNRSSARGPNR